MTPNQVALEMLGWVSGFYFAVVELTDGITGHYLGRQVAQIVIQR